jgi:hypothetical protein
MGLSVSGESRVAAWPFVTVTCSDKRSVGDSGWMNYELDAQVRGVAFACKRLRERAANASAILDTTAVYR